MNGKIGEDLPTNDVESHHLASLGISSGSRSASLGNQLVSMLKKSVAIVLYALRPAIYDYYTCKGPLKPQRLRETAYLDGLRGLACFNVFFFHRGYVADQNIGWGTEGQHWELHRLPILRLWYAGGHFSVGLFFVMSGYVISLKALSLMHSSIAAENEAASAMKDSQLLAVLQKSLIKRWFRLFIPMFACSGIVATMFHAGFANYMEPLPTLQDELTIWAREAVRVSNGYGIGGQSQFEMWERFNPNNWTIPIEFKCSLFVFLLLLSLSHIKNPRTRLLWISGHTVTAFFVSYWTITSFYLGVLLAELDTRQGSRINKESQVTVDLELSHSPHHDTECLLPTTTQVHPLPTSLSPLPPPPKHHATTSIGSQIGWWILLIVSLWAASAPVIDQPYSMTHSDPPSPPTPRAPYYALIYAITPTNLFFVFQDPESYRFITTLTSFLFLLSVKHLPIVKSWLCTRMVQRMGVISYAFYLVHNSIAYAVIKTVRMFFTSRFPGVFPTDEEVQGIWKVGQVVRDLGMTVWVADVFERGVDRWSIKISAQIERYLNS